LPPKRKRIRKESKMPLSVLAQDSIQGRINLRKNNMNKEFDAFVKSMEAWKENVAMQLSILHSSPSEETKKMFFELKDEIKLQRKEYASKWVEQLAKGAISAILLYFLGAILGLFTINVAASGLANILRFIS